MSGDKKLDSLTTKLAGLIREAERVVIFTGAGVSTESGLPDFRSPGGIWDRFNPDDFTYDKFRRHPSTRRLWWQIIREGSLSTAVKPNPAHHAVAELYRQGKLRAVITQNIDNLHQQAGVPDELVFELHGNLRWAVCLDCGRRYPFPEISARLADDGEVTCPACSGILKPNIVFFGEALPEGVFEAAAGHAEGADLLIVIGSSLVVYPAAEIPVRAYQAGARLAIVNLSPTPLDGEADIVIRARAGETMATVMAQVTQMR